MAALRGAAGAARAVAIVFILEPSLGDEAILLGEVEVIEEDFRDVAHERSPDGVRDEGAVDGNRGALADEGAAEIGGGRAIDIADGERAENASVSHRLGAQCGTLAEFVDREPIVPHGDGGKAAGGTLGEDKPLARLAGAAAAPRSRGPPEDDEGETAMSHVRDFDEQALPAGEADAGVAGEGIGHPQRLGGGGGLVGEEKAGQRVAPLAHMVGGVLGDAGFGGEPEDQAGGDGWVGGHGWVEFKLAGGASLAG